MQFATRHMRAKWKRNPKSIVGTWAIYHQARWSNGMLYESSVVECVHVEAKRALFITLDTRHMAENLWIQLSTVFDPDSRLSYLGTRSRLMWLGVGNTVIRPSQVIGNGRHCQVVNFGHRVEVTAIDNLAGETLELEITDALRSFSRPTVEDRVSGPVDGAYLDVWHSVTLDPPSSVAATVEVSHFTAWEMLDESV